MITEVLENSIAHEMEIEPGDVLVSINGREVKDVFDYRYLVKDEYLEIVIRKKSGEEWELEIEKDEDEDLGIVFDTGLMDRAKSCSNKCIFCFIDQLPKGMRETLYFKDDDSRLSFLQGNYVTLTNMSDADLDRIIYYHLSPINISVHATDATLREFMLKNPKSSRIMEQIKKLHDANIEMNYQVVLCKNINDGKMLDETIQTLGKLLPKGRSLSVVPVGLSKYRENLFPLESFTKQDAEEIISTIEKWQEHFKKKNNTAFVYAADEFYLKAEAALPAFECYEDFPQIENGVGMLAMFEKEFLAALECAHSNTSRKITVVTGMAAFDFIKRLSKMAADKFLGIDIETILVENVFMGENITVAGLLTGQDILTRLRGKDLGECVLLPKNSLRADSRVFLDDVTVEDLERQLNTKVVPVEIDGQAFLQNILGKL